MVGSDGTSTPALSLACLALDLHEPSYMNNSIYTINQLALSTTAQQEPLRVHSREPFHPGWDAIKSLNGVALSPQNTNGKPLDE